MKKRLMLHGLLWSCLLVLIGVMGWLSYSMLQTEQRRLDEIAGIRLVEQSRLALWRMDSQLSSMLLAENNRPPGEYAATASTAENRGGTDTLPGMAAFARLYFQIDPNGKLSSPQTDGLRMAVMAHMKDDGIILWLKKSLPDIPQPASIQSLSFAESSDAGKGAIGLFKNFVQELQNRLASVQDLQQLSEIQSWQQVHEFKADIAADQTQKAMQQGIDDYNLRRQVNKNNQTYNSTVNSFLDSSASEKAKVRRDAGDGKRKYDSNDLFHSQPLTRKNTAKGNASSCPDSLKTGKSCKQQASPSAAGLVEEVVVGEDAEKRGRAENNTTDASSLFTPDIFNGLFFRLAGNCEEKAQLLQADMQSDDIMSADTESIEEPVLLTDHGLLSISAFQPKWYKGRDCFLVRRVSNRSHTWMQGIWLDWSGLSAYLLQTVRDILPGASLEPGAEREESYLKLASIPAVLNPGSLPVVSGEGLETVWKSIIMSWVCGTLALCGVIGLIIGMLRLSERRAVFVSAVTHELRTPLTTFNMYTEMLSSGLVPKGKEMNYMDILKRESSRLTHLVDNVLSYARVEKNSVALHPEIVSVTSLASSVMARISPRLAGVDIDSLMYVEEKLQTEKALVDVTAVEQIVYNLADNAAKYARVPGSVLKLSMVREKRSLVLRVEDEGKGIPEALKGRLFRPFSRSAEEAAGKQPGVGLGLALSRELARKMGGELWLEASSGCGCRFALRLPLGKD